MLHGDFTRGRKFRKIISIGSMLVIRNANRLGPGSSGRLEVYKCIVIIHCVLKHSLHFPFIDSLCHSNVNAGESIHHILTIKKQNKCLTVIVHNGLKCR